MDKSVPPPNEKTVIGSGVAEQFSSSEFQPLVHELLNELTILNLCCFKIRDIAKRAGDNSILLRLDRMEKAVTRMAAAARRLLTCLGWTEASKSRASESEYTTKTSIRFSNAGSRVIAFFKRALAAGAKERKPVMDQFYGDRSGQLEDPFGHLGWVATHKEDIAPEEMRKRVQAMFGNKK